MIEATAQQKRKRELKLIDQIQEKQNAVALMN